MNTKAHLFMKILKNVVIMLVVLMVLVVALDFLRAPKPLSTERYRVFEHAAASSGVPVRQNTLTMVYIWAEWCGICNIMSPKMNDLYTAGYPVVTIALSSGTKAGIDTYLREHNYSFPVVNDNDATVSHALDVKAVPKVLFIKNGAIEHSMTGAHLTTDIILRYHMFK